MTQLRFLKYFYDMVPLTGGAYSARSVIANAERCVNLFPETNEEDGETPVTHLPTAGLTVFCTTGGQCVRGIYWSSWGQVYAVVVSSDGVNSNFGAVNPDGSWTNIGSIGATGRGPVVMQDNGTTLFIVFGSTIGWEYSVGGGLVQIGDPNFLGGTRVAYSDTFTVFNQPGTRNAFCTQSNSNVFNALYIAAKTGMPDLLVSIAIMHDELWLIGQKTTEVWYNAGNTFFPYSKIPGVFIEHGTSAPYSVAQHDLEVFFVSSDKDGQGIVARGRSYGVERISNYALEYQLSTYPTLTDAIGMTWLYQGHSFYVVTFPSADKTWAYDRTTGKWHELVWLDSNGNEHRHRANCATFAYANPIGGVNLVGDWQNGLIYKLDPTNYTDNGQPVIRRRGFMHLAQGGRRVLYRSAMADMDCGNINNVLSSAPPTVSLRWSDDRGHSWSNPVMQSMGASGQYITQPKWSRLGYARDRVFELFWSTPALTALNGLYIDPRESIS